MHFNKILTNPLHELGSPWQRAAPCPSRSAGGPAPPLLSGGADEVWGGVSLGPGRARAIPVGAGAGTLQPPRSCGWGGAERFPPSRRPRRARSFCTGVPPPAPAQLRPRARLPTCPAGSPFGHCHAQTVPRPAASDLLCSKGACRPLAAPARAAVCPELSPCCPTCRRPCCPGPRRKQDTRPSAASAELSLSLTALRLTED